MFSSVLDRGMILFQKSLGMLLDLILLLDTQVAVNEKE